MSRPRDAAQGRAGSRTSARTISSAARVSREELVGLLTEAHNRLGDCICTVGIDNSTERLLERIRAVLDKEDSVYAADE